MPTLPSSQQQLIDSLPPYLRPFVASQNYQRYNPRDQAVWRCLFEQILGNLNTKERASYRSKLKKSGIHREAIPRIEDISAAISQTGWRAVAVNGPLPLVVLMEFLALQVLAIHPNMRTIARFWHSSTPDIVHDTAGRVPYLLNRDYREFLQRLGELGRCAIIERGDRAVCAAATKLATYEQTETASVQRIDALEKQLERAQAANTTPSEWALLTRLHRWTNEYGLVGALDNPVIYGAKLLTSPNARRACLEEKKVRKLPLSITAINCDRDHSTQYPRLRVTESFGHLKQILDALKKNMACYQGGTLALEKALAAAVVCTIETNSGLQISGKLTTLKKDATGNGIYINTTGATQLSFKNTELDGHGRDYHAQGFGSPIGRLIGLERCLSNFGLEELAHQNIEINRDCELRYRSGIVVRGHLTSILRKEQKNILLSFAKCTVTDAAGNILFQPEWGMFDMAVGEKVVAVVGGPSDKQAWPTYQSAVVKTAPTGELNSKTRQQLMLYTQAEELKMQRPNYPRTKALAEQVIGLKDADWLLAREVLKLLLHTREKSTEAMALRRTLFLLSKQSVTYRQRSLIR